MGVGGEKAAAGGDVGDERYPPGAVQVPEEALKLSSVLLPDGDE